MVLKSGHFLATLMLPCLLSKVSQKCPSLLKALLGMLPFASHFQLQTLGLRTFP